MNLQTLDWNAILVDVGMVGDQLGIHGRRTEHNLRLELKISQLLFYLGDKVFRFFEVLVHFPVTDNNLGFRHNAFIYLIYFNY